MRENSCINTDAQCDQSERGRAPEADAVGPGGGAEQELVSLIDYQNVQKECSVGKAASSRSEVSPISREHPREAVEFLVSLPEEERSASYGRAAYMLVQNGGSAAADYWIETSASRLSEEEARMAFELSYGRMTYDHGFAAEWLAGETATRYFDEARQAQFASSWASKEPGEAADWAVASGREALLQTVISSCPDVGLSELAEWLTTRRSAAFFPSAARSFAERVGSTDPESARKWREASGLE